jgi:hypothetical protein
MVLTASLGTEGEKKGIWSLLFVRLPGHLPRPSGILLFDLGSDELHVALVESVSNDPDVAEVWAAMADELRRESADVVAHFR